MRPLLAASEGGGGGATAAKKPAERSCMDARRRETAPGRQLGAPRRDGKEQARGAGGDGMFWKAEHGKPLE
nr:unnamed protein product [Digitaria exilis]